VSHPGIDPPGPTSRRAEELFQQARALLPSARRAFLAEACQSDPRLEAELVSLLAHAEPAERLFAALAGGTVSPAIGQQIGHYHLLGTLGSGGMGMVYRAHDTRLDRDVALKFLPSHLSAMPEARERLLVEARAAAALEHPNVCSIHEIGETSDGRLFIAMACYSGETLRERLACGPLPPVEAFVIAVQIARGLAAAHAAGIVHRDVKPANVMLCADGTVRLLDFGLAKLTDVTLTGPGVTLGTLAYMSPEQAGGDAVDHRSDLWSLGVVMYEMLTGERPFRGGNDLALLLTILHQDPEPIARRRPEIPEPLPGVVERLLRKDPSARQASAAELVADLLRALPPGVMHVPVNEAERLAALRSYAILDTPPERCYDELVELAARICRTPAAYCKFFDDSRVWFKSQIGLPPDLKELPRQATLCNWTLCQPDLVVIPDCAADERFRNHSTVTGWPKVRFYCSMPLIDAEGYALGTFCVFDQVPREMSLEEQDAVRTLARQILAHLQLRRLNARHQETMVAAERARYDFEQDRARFEALLHKILPGEVADELKSRERVHARYHPLAAVLVGDFHEFDQLARNMEPATLVSTLDEHFKAFDDIIERHGLEKIGTLGNCYLCAGGIRAESRSGIVDACLAALAIQATLDRLNRERLEQGLNVWGFRIGIHAGPAMTGMVGRHRLTYDIWGEVVNVAHRLRAACPPDRVVVSDYVYQRLGHVFELDEPCGPTAALDGEPGTMHFLTRIKPDLSADSQGAAANWGLRDRAAANRSPIPPG
jgi:serine/threonine protein kinase/class 3 adenylate cyclase